MSTARSCEVGRLAPLAAATTRPASRVNSSRIRLDSLQSWLCSTNASCVVAAPRRLSLIVRGSFETVAAQVRFVVGPARAHLHPQRKHHLRVEKLLQLVARLGADALQALAAVADHDALVRFALDHDGGGDVDATLRGRLAALALARRSVYFLEAVDHHGRGVRQ